METKKEIKVLIVGDFLIFRNGLRLLLETEGKVKVAGEAADLPSAVNLINKVKPDLLLVESTELDNGNFTTFLSSKPITTPIIILTNSKDVEKHKEYLLLGVEGLVTKEQPAEVLFEAIKRVSVGDVWFDRKLMIETIKQLVHEKKLLPESHYPQNCAVLTDREREVLTLICKGKKNKVIADDLFITETTVRHHLTSIFEKLKVKSRLELVVYSFKEGLVEIPLENVSIS